MPGKGSLFASKQTPTREQNYPERATSVRKTLRVSRPARNTKGDLAESTAPTAQPPWAQRSPEPHRRDNLDDKDASQGQACESVAAPEPSLIGIIRHLNQATHISVPWTHTGNPRTQSASAIETVCVYRKAFGLGCVSKRARSQVVTCPLTELRSAWRSRCGIAWSSGPPACRQIDASSFVSESISATSSRRMMMAINIRTATALGLTVLPTIRSISQLPESQQSASLGRHDVSGAARERHKGTVIGEIFSGHAEAPVIHLIGDLAVERDISRREIDVVERHRLRGGSVKAGSDRDIPQPSVLEFVIHPEPAGVARDALEHGPGRKELIPGDDRLYMRVAGKDRKARERLPSQVRIESLRALRADLGGEEEAPRQQVHDIAPRVGEPCERAAKAGRQRE